MTEIPDSLVLILDAATGVERDALAAAGWAVADWTDGDDGAQVADFSSGIADQPGGNLIYLFGRPEGPQSQSCADIRAHALALAPNIRVNGICPGPVVATGAGDGTADIEQWSSLSLGLMVQTEEIVGAVRFILDTPSITGQVIALGAGSQANDLKQVTS